MSEKKQDETDNIDIFFNIKYENENILNEEFLLNKQNSGDYKKISKDINNSKISYNKKSNKIKHPEIFNEISFDEVERKLNRYSIAKDSLESSLINLPYSREVNK